MLQLYLHVILIKSSNSAKLILPVLFLPEVVQKGNYEPNLADVTGLVVNVPVVKEATALGCAIAAGVGVGIYTSLHEAGKTLVKFERQHQPNARN